MSEFSLSQASSFDTLSRFGSPKSWNTQYAGIFIVRGLRMDPEEIMEWEFRLREQASRETERSGIASTLENIPLIISQIPQDLQPVFIECKSHGYWFIPNQDKRPLTAEHIAGMMTVVYSEGYRWQLCGLGCGPQTGGVFLTGKVTPQDQAEIDRGIFPASLKVWGRAAEGLRNLPPDSPICQGVPGHDDYYRNLVLQGNITPDGPSEVTTVQQQESEGNERHSPDIATGWSSVEEWLDSVDDKADDDHKTTHDMTTARPTNQNDGAGALPSYDQATAGLSSPTYQQAGEIPPTQTPRRNRRRRDSMVKSARYNQS